MDLEILTSEITGALVGRRLLTHAYYQRWQEGRLTVESLREYAGQYRHFERSLPGVLRSILDDVESDGAAEFVRLNLADEEGWSGKPHVELFDGFARALGASPESQPTPATLRLLATYNDLGSAGPVQALAGLVAYESQASEVARTKAEGLRLHYGLGRDATEFWDVHADMDGDHAAWALAALAELVDHPDQARQAATRAASAWWEFLDEREEVASHA